MLFRGKYDRAMEQLRSRTPKDENDEGLSRYMEKGDLAAMLISAAIVILPVGLIVLGLLALVGFLFVV